MREFQAKRRTQRLLYSTGSIVLLLVIMVLLVKSVIGAYDKKRRSDTELARTQAVYENLTNERDNLSRNADFLKTQEGIDAELRSKYRLVRPGEGVAVIVEDDALLTGSGSVAGTAGAAAVDSSNGLWDKILIFFHAKK